MEFMEYTLSESRKKLSSLKSKDDNNTDSTDATCILESLPTPIVVLSPSGDLIALNQAAADFFEVERENAVGQPAGEVFSGGCAHTIGKVSRRSNDFCVVSQATLTHAGRDYTVIATPFKHDGMVAGAVIIIGPSTPSAPARDLGPVRSPDGAGYWVPVYIPATDDNSEITIRFR